MPTIPTKTAGSLGVALTDTRTPSANELSAVHVERIKDLLIEMAGEINTLETVLFEWNGVDTTQFGASVAWKTDLGTGPAGAPVLSVEPGPAETEWYGHNLLRIATTANLAGGYFFPPIVTLPVRYTVEMWLAGWTGAGDCAPVIVLAALAAAAIGNRRGLTHWLGGGAGGAANALGLIQAAGEQDGTVFLNNTVPYDTPRLESSLYRFRWEVRRPDGEATAVFGVTGRLDGSSPGDIGHADGIGDPQVTWNSATFDKCGPGIYNAGGAGGATMDILKFRILASPLG